MSNPQASNEPSMEEILASIRRIIADDDEAPPADKAQDDTPANDAPMDQDAADALFSEDAADEAFEAAQDDVFDAAEMAEGATGGDDAGDIDAFDAIDAEPEPESEPEPEPDVAGAGEDDVFALSAASIVADDDAPADDAEVDAPSPDADDLHFALTQPAAKSDAPDPIAALEPSPAPEPKLSAMAPFAEGAVADQLLSAHTHSAVSAAFGSLANTILSKDARTLEDLVSDMLRPMLKSWLDENLPPLVERLVREEIERVSRGGR